MNNSFIYKGCCLERLFTEAENNYNALELAHNNKIKQNKINPLMEDAVNYDVYLSRIKPKCHRNAFRRNYEDFIILVEINENKYTMGCNTEIDEFILARVDFLAGCMDNSKLFKFNDPTKPYYFDIPDRITGYTPGDYITIRVEKNIIML